MHNRFRSFAPVLMCAVMAIVVGCSGGTESTTKTEGAPSANESAKKGTGTLVGVVFDSGGRGDKSFNDSAYAGAERAESEFGVEIKTVDSRKESDYDDNLTAMAEAGCKVVFAVGLGQATAVKEVAPKFPEVKFALVDSVVEAPNVRSLLFSEEQGSFLAGYLAGLVSKTGKVGFVGGKNIPLIHKFEAGFMAGAKHANPKVVVLPAKYTDSWDDTSKGKAAAALLYGEGADIVYHAAGRCGLGVFAAAKEANGSGPVTKFAIGVDSNQDDVEKGIVLTSMVKRVDEAVFSTVQDVLDDKFSPGTKLYDVSANGVGLTDYANTKDVIGSENIEKVKAISDEIKAGKLTIPSKREEVEPFLAAHKK